MTHLCYFCISSCLKLQFMICFVVAVAVAVLCFAVLLPSPLIFVFFGLSETARISHVDIELSTACTHMMYTYREQKKVPPLTAYHKR